MRSPAVAGGPADLEPGSHVTKTTPGGRPCPYQRSTHATGPGDNTPRIINDRGSQSYRAGDQNPTTWSHLEGNGGTTFAAIGDLQRDSSSWLRIRTGLVLSSLVLPS